MAPWTRPVDLDDNGGMRAAVIGGGSWGSALASVLAANGHRVRIWARDAAIARALNEQHENPRYLPGIPLGDLVSGTTDLRTALDGAELVLLATPSHAMRAVVTEAHAYFPPHVPIVSASKGIENDTLLTMDEVLDEVLPPEMQPYLCYLSGPSFAKETAKKLPTAVVVAAHWVYIARAAQKAFTNDFFRCYTSPDVAGVELGGALKNVIAIAAGVSDGLELGNNARAGLMTRGLTEVSRLAVKRGANPLTLAGLAGMGDLVLTCTGELSRNRHVGMELGRGQKLPDILAAMGQVAEGVRTAKSVHDLAQKLGVEMPIHDCTYRMLHEGLSPKRAIVELMRRELGSEFEA